MQNKILKFEGGAAIVSAASVVGKYEYEGPLGDCFDLHDSTDKFGMKTWEKAESEMQRLAFNTALAKAAASEREVDVLFAGDLLNQCVGSSYGLLDFDIPYFGLYGACSTAAEGLMLAAMMTSAGYFTTAAAVTSSHYCSAERQYRTPLEYGAQRSPTAQWTVTGSGAFLVRRSGRVRITEALPGIVVEKGINDASNMGAAMAPAAADTLLRYFRYSDYKPEEFDLIVTGDLGFEGGSILCELLLAEGLDIRSRYNDCGMMIYDRKKQDMHSGGSGCGCSAVVLASHLYPRLERGELRQILLLGTGAMMSPASIQQGQAIPAVAHLLRIGNEAYVERG
ncbi:MAG: stage V sporulation protein AD [Ruminococcaceae bacterium]|nr:stage V sporulation protein AD [Oscillospiraceae bacterium]